MKKSFKYLGIGFVALTLFFSSCSRQTASLQSAYKLADAQTLQNAPSPKPEENISPKISIPTLAIEENQKPVLFNNIHSKTALVSKKIKHHINESILAKTAARAIVKQANSVLKPGLNRNISSYSGTNHTEGWIGLAITCLIVAIILFAFGFGLAAAILWEIGIVILVVALVFFILWLLASAAGA